MGLILPARFTQQPQGLVSLDWRNPITRGLVGLIDGSVAGGGRDLVANNVAPLVSGDVVCSSGRSRGKLSAAGFGGVTYGRMDTLSKNWRPTSPVLSMVCAFHPFEYGSSAVIATVGFSSGNSMNLHTNYGDGTLMAQLNQGTMRTVYGGGGNIKLNRLNVAAMTADGGTFHSYISGGLVGTAGMSTANMYYDPTYTRVSLGAALGGDFGGLPIAGHWMGLWNRALSPAEIRSLTDNPWQIFQAPTRKLWAGVASSNLDITGTLGTATANGFTANVNRQAAIAATLGTATAAGLTATVNQQLAVSATLGTATAAGFTAGVDQQTVVSATLGTATANGFTADVAFGGSLDIAATLGTATAAGFTANVDRQLAVSATLGTATADGFTADVAIGGSLNINATLGTATASGFTANVDQQTTITSTIGTATADGFTAAVDRRLNIAASLGLASADGPAAAVNLRRDIAATLGTATAAGFTAEIIAGGGTLSSADIEAIADAVMLRLEASFIPVDVKRVNGVTIIGDGSSVPFQV